MEQRKPKPQFWVLHHHIYKRKRARNRTFLRLFVGYFYVFCKKHLPLLSPLFYKQRAHSGNKKPTKRPLQKNKYPGPWLLYPTAKRRHFGTHERRCARGKQPNFRFDRSPDTRPTERNCVFSGFVFNELQANFFCFSAPACFGFYHR